MIAIPDFLPSFQSPLYLYPLLFDCIPFHQVSIEKISFKRYTFEYFKIPKPLNLPKTNFFIKVPSEKLVYLALNVVHLKKFLHIRTVRYFDLPIPSIFPSFHSLRSCSHLARNIYLYHVVFH